MSVYRFTSDQEQQMRALIHSLVYDGFTPREILVESAVEMFEHEFERRDLEPLIERLVDEEWSNHAREQASWEGLTYCDRLDEAFAALEKSGVVARQNFACCCNCGLAEIGDEVQGGDFDGFVFYHSQDTEGAVEGGGLFLAYGSFQEKDGAVAVGQRIVAALRSAGLSPDWNGSANQRIFVPLDWKKRRALA